MESMEVTREQHLEQTTTMDEKSASSKYSSQYSRSSPGNRKGVKARFVDLLKPKRNRGISAPGIDHLNTISQIQQQRQEQQQQHQRSRTFSSSSAPAASPVTLVSQQRNRNAREATPRRTRSYLPKSNPKSSTIRQQQLHRSGSSTHENNDNSSTLSDNVTVEGLRSVATNQTISSIETVKASNKTDLPSVDEDSPSRSEIGKSPWNAFKRALKPLKAPPSPDMADSFGRKTSNRTPVAKSNRRRIQSFDRVASGSKLAKAQQAAPDAMIGFTVFDQSVRGRFDGLDVMTLGSALWVNTPANATTDEKIASNLESPWEDTSYTVTGQSTLYSPAQLIQDMLWNSGGRPKPEIILEGFLPGPEDRWSVQIENMHNPSYDFTYSPDSSGPPGLQAASTDENTASTAPEDHYDSPMSSHKLWTSLWGSDPIPSGQPNRDLLTQVDHDDSESQSASSAEDPLLSLAANSSIPIDIDEDTFIVSTRDHLSAIQDIASVPISEGRFDTAVKIFEKLIVGLPSNASNERKYLRGAALHNIGLLHLWQGNYDQAYTAFTDALEERRKHMSRHLDLTVTQCRLAQSLFALERFDESISAFENCLDLIDEDGVVLAKVLNNLAVSHYHKGDVSKALRYLARALEQQREWLDGDVRRESIVYDASVSLSNMGKLYLCQTDYELCSGVYEEALLLQTSIFQKEHPAVMQAYVNLAWSKALNGHLRTAIRLLESCLRVQTGHYGADASATIETAGWMAHLYARSAKYKDALTLYQQIRLWQKQHLKTNNSLFFIPGSQASMHPAVKLVKECIKQIENPSSSKSCAWL
ncbi:hypothetical protein ACA910_013471 [Epithemia clementina (nom. ined.)]